MKNKIISLSMLMGTMTSTLVSTANTVHAASQQPEGKTPVAHLPFANFAMEPNNGLPFWIGDWQVTTPFSKVPVYGYVHGHPMVMEFFTGNGLPAYCTMYNNETPPNGTHEDRVNNSGAMMYKVMMYAWNGPYDKTGWDSNPIERQAASQIAVWLAANDFKINEIDWSKGNAVDLGKGANGQEISCPGSDQAARDRVKKMVEEIWSAAQSDQVNPYEVPTASFQQTNYNHDAQNDTDNWTIKLNVTNGYGIAYDKDHPTKLHFDHVPAKGFKVTQGGKEIPNGDMFNTGEPLQVSINVKEALASGWKLSDQWKIHGEVYSNNLLNVSEYMPPKGSDLQGTMVEAKNNNTYMAPSFENTLHDSEKHDKPQVPTITTTAVINGTTGIDNRSVRNTNPNNATSVTDNVALGNLSTDTSVNANANKYHIKLQENEVDNGKLTPLQGVTAEKDVTATNANMSVPVTLPNFKADSGKKYVITATLSDSNGKVVAQENSATDADETITVGTPTMHTTAMIDGKANNVYSGGIHTAVDRVEYHGVTPNQQLNQVAVAQDANGKPMVFTINGKQYNLVGNINFTPTTSDGSVDVPMELVEAGKMPKAVALKEAMTNPDQAAKDGGNTDLAHPYSIDFSSVANKSFGISEIMNSYNNGKTGDTTTIAHDDVKNDKSQGINVLAPQMHTVQLLDGSKVANPNSGSRLYDKIHYTNAIPGQALETSGIEYDQDTKKPVVVTVDGKQYNLMTRINFVPKASEGDVLAPVQLVPVMSAKTADSLQITNNSNTTSAAMARIKANPIKVAPTTTGANSQGSQQGSQVAAGSSVSQVASKASQASQAASVTAGNNASQATSAAKQAVAQQAQGVNVSNQATGVNAGLINTESLRGKHMVMVEDMSTEIDSNNSSDKTAQQSVISSEADLNNKDQEVDVTAPKIGTKAYINHEKVLQLQADAKDGKNVSLTDECAYSGMAVGQPFHMVGVEMDQSTGKPVMINGQYLVGEATVTPKSSNGTVTLHFKLVKSLPQPVARYTAVAMNKDGETVSAAKQTSGSNSQATSAASQATSGVINVSQASQASSASQAGTSQASQADNTDSNIDISSLKPGKYQWTAFETAENVGTNGQIGNVIGEDKDIKSDTETVGVDIAKKPTPTTKSQEHHDSPVETPKETPVATTPATPSEDVQAPVETPTSTPAKHSSPVATAPAPHFAQTGAKAVQGFWHWVKSLF